MGPLVQESEASTAMSYPVWIVASACRQEDQETLLRSVQSNCSSFCTKDFQPAKFGVPSKFNFTIDERSQQLTNLCDILAKMDNQVESLLRRIDRQLLNMNANAEH